MTRRISAMAACWSTSSASRRWASARTKASSSRTRSRSASLVGRRAAVVWNLVNLRAERLAVSYLDDSSVHEQMVRFATAQWRAGHLPLTGWFMGSAENAHVRQIS